MEKGRSDSIVAEHLLQSIEYGLVILRDLQGIVGSSRGLGSIGTPNKSKTGSALPQSRRYDQDCIIWVIKPEKIWNIFHLFLRDVRVKEQTSLNRVRDLLLENEIRIEIGIRIKQ